MVSVILPTTGRPQMAVDTLDSILSTTEQELEFVIAIDHDEETIERVGDFFGDRERVYIDYCEEYRGCSKAWNDAFGISTGDPVVFAADDLIFHPGWLDAALDKMKELPEGGGLVGFNDTKLGDSLSTHYLMSRWFIDNCLGGVVAWDFYKHSFNDLEVNERAKRAGRYIYAPDAVVEHRHWIWGTRPQDDTDRRFLGEHASSQAKFNERAAAGFPD